MGERCDYKIGGGCATSILCGNGAKYVVEYTTPDDGKTMRARRSARRCYWHRDGKFLPEGATQIVWSNLADPAAAPRPTTEDDNG